MEFIRQHGKELVVVSRQQVPYVEIRGPIRLQVRTILELREAIAEYAQSCPEMT